MNSPVVNPSIFCPFLKQGRQGASSIEKETWATVKNRQADVNFQFQVHPVKDNSGVFEYAVPEVIFNLL